MRLMRVRDKSRKVSEVLLLLLFRMNNHCNPRGILLLSRQLPELLRLLQVWQFELGKKD